MQHCDPLKTLAAANYFLSRGKAERVPIDPLKLQKLVYFAHGWHLTVTGEPLIDEYVEAWPYGPVIPSIYHAFKEFGNNPITNLAYVGGVAPMPTDPNTLSVLDRVWDTYGRLSGIQLSNLSHAPGSPWEQAWNRAQEMGKVRGVPIHDSSIQEFFYETGLAHGSPEDAATATKAQPAAKARATQKAT
jgi:uncharacterized phage-associated protein